MRDLKFTISALLLAAVACLTTDISATTTLPEPELAWKNATFRGWPITVFSLYSDSRGVMWLGTNNGLYFYDGVNTHPLSRQQLSGTQIYSIVEYDHNLLLGTNNGLMLFSYDGCALTTATPDAPKEIRCMMLIDNTLLIGSIYGLYSYDLKSRQITDISEGLPHISVYSLLRDSRGIVYAGTYNGLARWDSNRHHFNEVRFTLDKPHKGNLFVNCMMESTGDNCIYIGSEGSLYRYYPVSDTWDTYAPVDGNNIKCLANIDNSGHFLIGTDDGMFDCHHGIIRHYRHDSRQYRSLSDNEIWCITTDKYNNVWTGHERGFSIASHSNSIKHIRLSELINSGEGNEISEILRDSDGDLWLGGSNGALRLTAGNTPRWYRHNTSPRSLPHNRVRSIEEDSDGHIWLSSDGGINRYNPVTDDFDVFHIEDSAGQHNSNWIYDIKDDGDAYWIGGYLGGLHRIDKSRFKPGGGNIVSDETFNAESSHSGFTLENNLINTVLKDNHNNIWILLYRDATLTRYNPDTKAVSKYDIFAMTGQYPSHIGLDNSDRLWCTFNGGAIIIDGDNTPTTVNFADNTEDEAVLAIGKVGDDMWISTLSNVWSINGHTFKESLLPIPQKTYKAIYQDPATGYILLGGTDELLEVVPDSISTDSDIRSIKLVLADNGDGTYMAIRQGGAIDPIPYGGSISLIVSTLDYSPESVHRYMYCLTDADNDEGNSWIVLPEGVNTITLTEMKMGTNRVLIKPVGSPSRPFALQLSVSPPVALSWWAITLYILVLTASIVAIIWYVRRRNLQTFHEQQRKKALENVEKKLSFLSDISHDLKTPLSMIMGPVSLMKERAKDAEIKKTLESVYDNAVRLNNMIHRTIELNHLDDDEEDMLILSTFDAVEFCKGVFETFEESHPEKRFIFHTECQQLLIEADAVKFESVITNLLSNACKYSEDGATISCGISRHGDNVEIVVSDDGLGIAETDQPLVFQRMFRSQSTASLREGTGLGLYLIKRYLELMHGNVELYSHQGQGTSFIVTLPVTDKQLTSAHNNPADNDSNKPKILIVEDNQQIQTFIADLLESDYTVIAADNGRAGLSIASSFYPDLIIADEMMPIMSGLEMCRRLKQNPRLATVPVIMLTAKTDNATENESIRLGVDAFMHKPFEPAALIGRIRHLITSRDIIKESVRIQTITQPKPIEAESHTEKQLARIAKTIEDNISDPDLNVNLLCEKCDIPNKQLYRIIKKYIGVSPVDYIRRVRLQKAAMLLSQHRFTVSEISYMVGFKTPSYFAKCFQSQYGVKPSQYQSDDENTTKV